MKNITLLVVVVFVGFGIFTMPGECLLLGYDYNDNNTYMPPTGNIENNTEAGNEPGEEEGKLEKIMALKEAVDQVSIQIEKDYEAEGIPEYQVPYGVAAYFKVPVDVYYEAEAAGYLTRCPECYLDREIPKMTLAITTSEPVTDEHLSALEEAGYTVKGAMGNMVLVEAEITTLLNLETGLQNFDFVQYADLPGETILNF